jgi:exodeoxyribonuclease VII small subunit
MAKSRGNFEKSINELEDIVDKLERGELSLDESVEIFQKGITLSKDLNKMLDDVQRKISILIEDEKGNFKEENFINTGENDEF